MAIGDIFFALFLIGSSAQLSGQELHRRPFQAGEVLKYGVHWGFIRLGTIVFTQQLRDAKDSSSYVVTLSGESSPMLKFIDAAFANRAVISSRSLASLEYISEVGRKKHLRIVQRLDAKRRSMIAQEVRDGKQVVNTSIPNGQSLFNDLSFLMYVRKNAGSGLEADLPSIFKDTIVTTHIKLPQKAENVDVEALKKPAKAHVFEARANWTNQDIAGFRGEFRGYVMDHPSALLLRLEAKVLIGSIVVELESIEHSSELLR